MLFLFCKSATLPQFTTSFTNQCDDTTLIKSHTWLPNTVCELGSETVRLSPSLTSCAMVSRKEARTSQLRMKERRLYESHVLSVFMTCLPMAMPKRRERRTLMNTFSLSII